MDRRSSLRRLLVGPALVSAALPALAVESGRVNATEKAAATPPASLRFPVDFGSHPEARTEWWYVTGSLQNGTRLWGFQVTFFRSMTGIGSAGGSRFAPSQLLFAHAAVTDLEQKRLRHDQRIARSGFGIAEARLDDTGVTLHDWQMNRSARADAPRLGRYRARIASDAARFAFELQFDSTQPLLLQGDGGFSKKGPADGDASRYYSEPQLAVSGRLTLDGKASPVQGRAWLDHEWSDAFVPAGAVGWDWIGMNLDDGSALTAFRLRRADGGSVYAGGSFRPAGAAVRSFGPDEVRFTPLRVWESAASRGRYPVQWGIETPTGRFQVDALLDDQELDSRGSSGAIYWEGLSELRDAAGRPVGRGYLEMTGYAAALRL